MPTAILRRLLGAGRVRFFTKQVYYIDLADLPRIEPVLRYRFGDRQDLRGLASHPDYPPASFPYLEGRIAAGDRLVLGELDGEVALTAWVMGGHMELGDQIIALPPDHAYNYKIYTVEKYRRRGVATGLWSFLRQALPEHGFRRMINTVIAGNLQSTRAHERAGFRPAGVFYEVHARDASCYLLTGALRRFLQDSAAAAPAGSAGGGG